ncbi:WD40-repeat-containing domain protein [Phakopsora pachyrhizi]|nr:WD40-repeat-containing domain protein [Phakopsora pachyrhizi]
MRSRSSSIDLSSSTVADPRSRSTTANTLPPSKRSENRSSIANTSDGASMKDFSSIEQTSNQSIPAIQRSEPDLTAERLDLYKDHIYKRRKLVTAPRKFSKPPLIDPLVFIPHGSPVHALCIPPCGSHLFSGGHDGFIRRIAIYESVTGSNAENLTMRQGGHVALTEKEGDKTTIFLSGYWENEDGEGAASNILKPATEGSHTRNSHRWGPKSVGNASKVSPVYSLAVHSEELWGVSGTESGNINLFTVRHDEGQIRHIFKSAELPPAPLSHSSPIVGHKTGTVVSCLDLNHDQNVLYSGGWDGNVLGWDLNTGQVVNKFIAHASQISTVTMRPEDSLSLYDSKWEDTIFRSPVAEEPVHPSEQSIEREPAPEPEPEPEPELEPVSKSELYLKPEARLLDSPEKPTKIDTPPSSPEKPLAIAGESEDYSDDGSLFGGADNSASDDGYSTDAMPIAKVDSKKASDRLNLSLPGSEPNSYNKGSSGAIAELLLPAAATRKPTPPPAPPPAPILPTSHLVQVPSVMDSSLPFLNEDILMTSGIDGQVYLWDRRIEPGEGKGLVRKLDLPKGTSPWTSSATWSTDGRSVYVGRRNHSVDIYDLRFIRTNKTSSVQRTIRLPLSSGPVSCVKSWPDGKGILCASFDNIRLWNLQAESDGVKIPFKIIPGNSSGVVSQMCVTPSQRFLITASGDRGWENQSNEYVVIHEVRSL